jgi:hypothetical protein
MKSAWVVYFEAVEREVDGGIELEAPIEPDTDEFKAFVSAFQSARASTTESLVKDERWSESAATWLSEEFFRTSLDWLDHSEELGLVGLRVRLRHRYEDWLRN